jgi:adenine-specific DNA-methyltransferase
VRNLILQAFTEGRIDPKKLHLTLGDLADEQPERYSFFWAGNRDAIRLLAERSSVATV